MKIVGILGSARKGGNTEALLDTALDEARERGCSTTRIVLRDKTIAPCDGCMGCAKTGECVIKDGMGEVYEGIRESDGVIWATPVYFWSMSGLTKIALDRTFALNFPTLPARGENRRGNLKPPRGQPGLRERRQSVQHVLHLQSYVRGRVRLGICRRKGRYQEGRPCSGSDKDDGSPNGGALSRQPLVSRGV